MDWFSALNALKAQHGCTEIALASLVGIKKGFLGDIRSGRRPMPVGVKLAIADQLNYCLTRELLISLLDESAQRQIVEMESKKRDVAR